MLAFSNMFYVQLGSVMEDYNDQALDLGLGLGLGLGLA